MKQLSPSTFCAIAPLPAAGPVGAFAAAASYYSYGTHKAGPD